MSTLRATRIIPCPAPGGYGIAEFDRDARDNYLEQRKLTCKLGGEATRLYYQSGDVIMVLELRPVMMKLRFPFLAEVLDEFATALATALDVEFATGLQIATITPEHGGDGYVDLRTVLIIDSDELKGIVELDETQSQRIGKRWKGADTYLADTLFLFGTMSNSSYVVEPVAKAIGEFVTGVAGGFIKTVGKSIAFRLGEKSFARAVSRWAIVRFGRHAATETILNGSMAFAKAAIAELLKGRVEQRLRMRVKPPLLTDQDIATRVIVAGTAAFVGALVGGFLGPKWSKNAKSFCRAPR